jgi:NAD(P)-dependent dehydrogenase (short-subunit alcohol dehydrogenase family)
MLWPTKFSKGISVHHAKVDLFFRTTHSNYHSFSFQSSKFLPHPCLYLLLCLPLPVSQSWLLVAPLVLGQQLRNLQLLKGFRVAIASSNPERVANAVKKIESSVPNAQVVGYTIDLNHDDIESRLEKLFIDVTTATGIPLDHIVYTAVSLGDLMQPLSEVTADSLRTSGQFGFTAPLLIGKLAPRFLNSSYKSSVTFTSGRVAEKPVKGYLLGSSWGAALFGITRTLALHLAPIRVNLVSPGATNTELWGVDEKRAQMDAVVAQSALLGKAGTAEEVAEAYIYLMKDSNNTGTCVSTSGGSLLQ